MKLACRYCNKVINAWWIVKKHRRRANICIMVEHLYDNHYYEFVRDEIREKIEAVLRGDKDDGT